MSANAHDYSTVVIFIDYITKFLNNIKYYYIKMFFIAF